MLSEDLTGGASNVGNLLIGNKEELYPAWAISLGLTGETLLSEPAFLETQGSLTGQEKSFYF